MTSLIKWDKAKQAIMEAHSVDELAEIRDYAEAKRYALKLAGEAPEVIRQAEEIKLRAERRAGEVLKEMKDRGEIREHAGVSELQGVTHLPEIGISKQESSKWQRIADIPEEEFEEYIKTSPEITTSGAIKISNKLKRPIFNTKTEIPKEKFSLIYADPPWQYEYIISDNRAIENQYPTLTLEEIKELEIPSDKDCILFLWATAPKLEEAISVISAWGFKYRTCAIWDKVKMGMGYYFRIQHELLLIGIKGEISPPEPENRIRSIIKSEYVKHSKKPDLFYDIIEKMYPDFKKIELFARNEKEGWESWGNEL